LSHANSSASPPGSHDVAVLRSQVHDLLSAEKGSLSRPVSQHLKPCCRVFVARSAHICPAIFSKPSDGLEPSTPSLPWRFRRVTRVHARSLATQFLLQIHLIRSTNMRREASRVSFLMSPFCVRWLLLMTDAETRLAPFLPIPPSQSIGFGMADEDRSPRSARRRRSPRTRDSCATPHSGSERFQAVREGRARSLPFLLSPASLHEIRFVSGGGGIRTLEGPNGP
jgi:hypothetical protein